MNGGNLGSLRSAKVCGNLAQGILPLGEVLVSESYVGRILRLTLLAPDIVEAILSGRALKAQRKELRRLLGGRLRFDY